MDKSIMGFFRAAKEYCDWYYEKNGVDCSECPAKDICGKDFDSLDLDDVEEVIDILEKWDDERSENE